MSSLRTAAQQAIALICSARLCEVNSMSSRQEMLRLLIEATDLLRAALAEPVQEPMKLHDGRLTRYPDGSIGAGTPQAALKAALAEPTRSRQLADAGFTRRPSLWSLQAREALELIAAPQRSDGTWNRDREACRQIAAEALGRYEDD